MGNRHRKSRPSAQHDGSAPAGIRRCNAAGMAKASKHVNPGKERFYGRLPRKVVSRCCSGIGRSEEHTSELQSLMRISYAVFCLKKKNTNATNRILQYYLSVTRLNRQQSLNKMTPDQKQIT